MTAIQVEPVSEPRGLRLTGELDLATVAEVAAVLRPMVEQGGEITLDMSALRFMDSSAVQLLIRSLQDLRERGRVILVRPGNTVKRLIEVMGLDRFDNLELRE